MRIRNQFELCLGAGLIVAVTVTGCASRRTTASTGANGTTTASSGANATTTATADGKAAKSEQVDRIQDAIEAFEAIMASPDKSIPQELLSKAECVVIVPGMKKGAFVVGAQYGKGYFSCRQGSSWTPPATVRIEGGSVGFQIGAQETDVIMLVMNEQGKERLLQNQFTLGADASVAAGPVGREAQAATDAYMTAEILAWSRSRGVFAGVSLEGATLREDVDSNAALYGKPVTSRDIVSGAVQPTPAGQRFIATLNKCCAR
jgi:lipid-binding SYLF domain-containing protein